MRIVRSAAVWVVLPFLLFGPALAGVFFPIAFLPSLALWFVVFIVVPAVAEARGGRRRRRGYGPYKDWTDLPWQGGTGAS